LTAVSFMVLCATWYLEVLSRGVTSPSSCTGSSRCVYFRSFRKKRRMGMRW
jgi:hypothetical protein